MNVTWLLANANNIMNVLNLILPFFLGLLAYAKRTWIADFFLPRFLLIQKLNVLESRCQVLAQENISLKAQATGWEGAAQAGVFSRHEAEVLIKRIDSLEDYVPKFQIAVSHIKKLEIFIVKLLEVIGQGGLSFSESMPKHPEEISKDLEV